MAFWKPADPVASLVAVALLLSEEMETSTEGGSILSQQERDPDSCEANAAATGRLVLDATLQRNVIVAGADCGTNWIC